MSNNFDFQVLGEVCKVLNGRAYKQEELLEDGKYRVLRVGNFFSNNSWYYSNLELEEDKYCENGDLLFAWSASFGPKIWNQEKVIYHYHIWKLIPDIKKLDRKFLYYYLFQRTNSMIGSTHGSIMLHITKGFMESLPIWIPDLNSQQKIALVLSSFDDKIEINNKINAELKGMAKLIYDYWFVQFDFPFDFAQGKPADETSNPKDIKPYKSSGGMMVWNKELNREIPEGWEVKKMREVLSIKNGRDHKHLELGTIPVYGSGGIMRYANSYLYNSESILIPRKGSLGNLFYINKPFWCVDTIFYTHMKFPHSCKYLFYTIRNLNISSMNTGTAVPSMTTEVLNNLSLIFPPMECLKKFDEILSPTFQMKNNHSDEIKELSALRDWLLPMLMNGQVRIDDQVEKKYEVRESEVGMAAEPGERYGVGKPE